MKTYKKSYIVTKTIVYKYNVEANTKRQALEQVRLGYDPYQIDVKSETVKEVKEDKP